MAREDGNPREPERLTVERADELYTRGGRENDDAKRPRGIFPYTSHRRLLPTRKNKLVCRGRNLHGTLGYLRAGGRRHNDAREIVHARFQRVTYEDDARLVDCLRADGATRYEKHAVRDCARDNKEPHEAHKSVFH